MFDKLKRAIGQKVDEVREATGAPADPQAIPDVAHLTFGEIDPGVLGAYCGRQVVSIEHLGALGPQATSFLGKRLQDTMRGAGGGAPGELFAGQQAAREERLRAEGMSEEQIAIVRQRIADVTAEHTRDGWDVEFLQDHRASVQIVAIGTDAAEEHDRLERRWARENGTDGHKAQDPPLLSATVQRYTKGADEAYVLSGVLTARSPTHVAIVRSPNVSTPVLAALASVALRCRPDPT